MRKTLKIMALAVLCAAPATAQEAPRAIERVITDQVEAFRAGDFGRAFTHAAPGIQRLFGTPERFGAMVRQGYPMVIDPRGMRFLPPEQAGDALRQRVLVTGPEGRPHMLEYTMVRADGRWRIAAVRVLQAPTVGA